jgi:replication-associated recombination protein RarA
MTNLIGHENQFKLATTGEVTNLFVYGPSSVGKGVFVDAVIAHYNIQDVLKISPLTIDSMEEIRQEAVLGGDKAFVIDLGYSTTLNLRERLLKVVEDAPSTTKFFLISVAKPDLALRTRFESYALGFLTPIDIQLILTQQGYSVERAIELSQLQLGTVSGTVYAGKTNPDKFLVLRALSAIQNSTEDELDSLYSKWTDSHTSLIREWAAERITGRWRLFSEDDSALNKGIALKVLKRVNPFDRPRYVVRSSLVSILREAVK